MIFAAIVMMAGFSTSVTAQTNTSAALTTNAGAVLIIPMTLVQTSPLHFGTITLLSTAGGTVTLSTANNRTYGGTGVAASTSVTPPSANAAYTVKGTYNQAYALTLPATITVTEEGLVGTMIISDLTVKFGTTTEKTAVAATSVLDTAGDDNFIVGGMLTVASAQIGGVYAGTFPVSVDYN